VSVKDIKGILAKHSFTDVKVYKHSLPKYNNRGTPVEELLIIARGQHT